LRSRNPAPNPKSETADSVSTRLDCEEEAAPLPSPEYEEREEFPPRRDGSSDIGTLDERAIAASTTRARERAYSAFCSAGNR